MKNNKIYISGGMRGYPELNFPLFNKVAELWRSRGYEVLNPAENFGGSKDVPYDVCIKRDIEQLKEECYAIALLPAWEASEGARLELQTALDGHYKIYDAILMHELAADICREKLDIAKAMYDNQKSSEKDAPKGTKMPLAIKSMELVNKTRQADYGSPMEDFTRASGMLASLGYCFKDPLTKDYRPFAARDIPIFMSCVKLSRLVNKFTDDYYHIDSVLDIHGYLNTLESLYE